jgi:hypothetical protein
VPSRQRLREIRSGFQPAFWAGAGIYLGSRNRNAGGELYALEWDRVDDRARTIRGQRHKERKAA